MPWAFDGDVSTSRLARYFNVYPYAHNTAFVISAAMEKMHLETEEVSPLSPSEPAKGYAGQATRR